ncbi:hypothetical protein ABZ719_26930 [Streptomyces sp. NPDC006743]|uniref:hypothetical protein n=1 Tax=Streptomyces sp. NPDC006743 TaxID=3154480 RepID=UPI0034547191
MILTMCVLDRAGVTAHQVSVSTRMLAYDKDTPRQMADHRDDVFAQHAAEAAASRR